MASCERSSTQAPLFVSRRFAPLFWCQFFAAFDDNFFKSALALFILGHVGGERGAALATLATATLMAPYFILSSLGGGFADKYDKAVVAKRLKLIEIAAAALAGLGFFLNSLPALFLALAAFGALGALFGPVKYAALPDFLPRDELPAGNALIEGATFVAILLGSIGGALSMQGGGSPPLTASVMVSLAAASYSAARFIPSTPRAGPRNSRSIATSRGRRRCCSSTFGARHGSGGSALSRRFSGSSARSSWRCCRRSSRAS
ncbi:MAG: MFS transporter [Methylocystis sp.]